MRNGAYNELAKSSDYYLERHRFYELKHFCLQYYRWMEMREQFDGYSGVSVHAVRQPKYGRLTDQTERTVELRMMYEGFMDVVKEAARATDAFFANYILQAVTLGLSYEQLRARTQIPCDRKRYYQMYRKFFWVLDKMRQ